MKSSDEQVEGLWVKVRGQANKGNLAVGVYYRSPDQGENVGRAFFLPLREASRSQSLILLGDSNHPDICWKCSTASCKQSGRLLECIEDNFLMQLTDSPTRGEALPDRLLTNTDELTRLVAGWAAVITPWRDSRSRGIWARGRGNSRP